MRARLLDLGEVAPVRAQSLYHAVGSLLGEEDQPVVILLELASPVVLLGAGETLSSFEAESDRTRAVPLVRWPGESVLHLAGGALVFQLLLPERSTAALGLPAAPPERLERLTGLVAGAYRAAGLEVAEATAGRITVAGSRLGRVALSRLGACLLALGELRPPRDRRAAEALAEGFARSLEQSLGLELVPSMPTPAEMEAVYAWDEELLCERADLAQAVGGPIP